MDSTDILNQTLPGQLNRSSEVLSPSQKDY